MLEEVSFTTHIRSWGEETKAVVEEAGFKARRRVVAPTHGWLSRFRRILVLWDNYSDISLPCFISLAPSSLPEPPSYWDRLLLKSDV